MSLTPNQWIDAYRRAWIEADTELVTSIFAQDGEYWWNLTEQPAVGRDEIEQYWDRETSRQSDVSVVFGTPINSGSNSIVVEFWTRMRLDGARVTLPGCMFLRFDGRGKCLSLREYWFEADGDHPPPAPWGH